MVGCERNGMVFQPISKCASCSLTDILFKAGAKKITDFDPTRIPLPLVVMLREPHERMQSAYRWLCRKGIPGFSTWVIEHCTHSESDQHIYPQARHMDRRRPDILIRWDFAEFSRLFNVELPSKINVSPFQETTWTKEALQVFDKLYQDDIRIWNQVPQD